MKTTPILQIIVFTAPIICALCCMALMLMDGTRKGIAAQDKHIRLWMATTYLVAVLCRIGWALYIIDREFMVSYRAVFLLALMLKQVCIYRFVHILTNTGANQKTSFVNRLLSTIITITSILIYLYPIPGLIRIKRYRGFIVNYSADEQRTSLRWLSAVLILMLLAVPLSLWGLLLGINTFTDPYFIGVGAVLAFVAYVVMCYNLLADNYIIIAPDGKEEINPEKFTIDRRKFERYMRDKKPYLNPKLRIIDVAASLHTNRSYMSAFINGEYGMSFSHYINRQRLEELDRLRTSTTCAEHTNMQLVLMVGFSNYRSYLRAKDEEDKRKILKVFE